MAVFLDYDGTLTPVQARPQDAVLGDEMRRAVRALAERGFVAIVTGRGLADVRALVDLPELVYAANHGLEIAGPGIAFEADASLRPTFEALRPEVDALVDGIDGVVVEHKGFSIAIHVRLVAPEHARTIEAGVDRLVKRHPGLRKTTGKALMELRPALAWHKGAAVRWLCDRLAQEGPRPVPIAIGDDRTDEDALAVVRGDGVGIVVGTPQWETAARFRLRDTEAVRELLERLTSR